MTVAVSCLECGRPGQVPDRFLGRLIECPVCQSRFHVARFLEDLRTSPEATPVPWGKAQTVVLMG